MRNRDATAWQVHAGIFHPVLAIHADQVQRAEPQYGQPTLLNAV